MLIGKGPGALKGFKGFSFPLVSFLNVPAWSKEACNSRVRRELLCGEKWLNGKLVFLPSNCFDMSSN